MFAKLGSGAVYKNRSFLPVHCILIQNLDPHADLDPAPKQSGSMIWIRNTGLKVPKREISVTEFFILSDPIWVGDLRTKPKKPFV
jgi:hypothetical protein